MLINVCHARCGFALSALSSIALHQILRDWNKIYIGSPFEVKSTKKISVDSHPLQMETAALEILTDKTINPVFQRAYNVRGWVNTRAYEIKHEMALVSVLYSLLWIIQTHNPSFSAFFVRYIWKQYMLQLCSCLTALESHIYCRLISSETFAWVSDFYESHEIKWFACSSTLCKSQMKSLLS